MQKTLDESFRLLGLYPGWCSIGTRLICSILYIIMGADAGFLTLVLLLT